MFRAYETVECLERAGLNPDWEKIKEEQMEMEQREFEQWLQENGGVMPYDPELPFQ